MGLARDGAGTGTGLDWTGFEARLGVPGVLHDVMHDGGNISPPIFFFFVRFHFFFPCSFLFHSLSLCLSLRPGDTDRYRYKDLRGLRLTAGKCYRRADPQPKKWGFLFFFSSSSPFPRSSISLWRNERNGTHVRYRIEVR